VFIFALAGRAPRDYHAIVVIAYILVQVASGSPGVSREIAKIKGVESSEDVSGPYDIIARAEARSLKELGDKVLGAIHGLEGVVRTLTCPVVHG